MNGQHFRTIVWLRWRLRLNQLKRGGTANVVVVVILLTLGVLAAIGAGIGGFLIGLFGLRDASPGTILLTWDGLAGVFLFFWLIGLMTELQRSEALSLDKFLHLPVTPTNVFVMNYLSSLVRVSPVIFAPAMLGMSLGLVLSRGPVMLWLFPLMAAFFLMVTAVTYQFQGWLAALMANPRRRRTIIVTATIVFVLLMQLPNLLNVTSSRKTPVTDEYVVQVQRENEELERQRAAGQISEREYELRTEDNAKRLIAHREDVAARELTSAITTAELVSAVVPPGWLPMGAMATAAGSIWPAIACFLGMALIGSLSLWRAYRTTLGLYTGQFTAAPAAAPSQLTTAVPADRQWFFERQVPAISEQASAVAVAMFRSLLRAPEAKMLLLTPFLMVIVFGSMLVTRRADTSELGRVLVAFGAIAMTLLSFVQIVGNQFGFDRAGFRVFVLSPAARRDILLGKNLAVAPLALAIAWTLLILVQILRPLRYDHFLSLLPQSVSMLLIFFTIANWLSIISPLPIAAGSLRPSHPRWTTILLQLCFTLMFPVAMAPTLLPILIEQAVPADSWLAYAPICLVLSIVVCALAIVLYRFMLTNEGAMLQAREQKILEIVSKKAE